MAYRRIYGLNAIILLVVTILVRKLVVSVMVYSVNQQNVCDSAKQKESL